MLYGTALTVAPRRHARGSRAGGSVNRIGLFCSIKVLTRYSSVRALVVPNLGAPKRFAADRPGFTVRFPPSIPERSQTYNRFVLGGAASSRQ